MFDSRKIDENRTEINEKYEEHIYKIKKTYIPKGGRARSARPLSARFLNPPPCLGHVGRGHQGVRPVAVSWIPSGAPAPALIFTWGFPGLLGAPGR